MARRFINSAEHGFTIVEVMVAMVILVIGLGGTATLLDQANATTTSNRAREGAIALSRELVEAARGQPYDQLTQGNVVSTLRATAGFSGSAITGSGWEIDRRGLTYTMAVGVCSVDDSNDGLGGTDSSFCGGTGAPGATTTTAAACSSALGRSGNISGAGTATGAVLGDCGADSDKDGQVDNLTLGDLGTCAPGAVCSTNTSDTNPDDYKRVVTLVRWTSGAGNHYVLQSTSLPYPGLSGAPRIVSMTASPGLSITTGSTFSDAVVTNRKAAGVTWLVDGTPFGTATSANATNWSFSWDLGSAGCIASPATTAPRSGEVVDGAYLVGAKAVDSYAQAGPTRTQTVSLNRCQPYAPTGIAAARIGGLGVEAAWSANPERDIEGYALYRQQGSGTAQLVCSMSRNRNCVESSPPNSGSWDYYAVAYDKDTSGSFRSGMQSSRVTIDLANNPPLPPTGALTGTRGSTSSVSITWLASAGDPDAGDSVAAYRIYRDGTTLSDRYATVTAGTYSYTDTAATDSHTYYVAAVDTRGAESAKSAGVDVP